MSDQIDNGGPAFPCPSEEIELGTGSYPRRKDVPKGFGGMSLRDYFAANCINPSLFPEKAQTVLLEMAKDDQLTVHDLIAKAAYRMADAMLKARKA